MKKHLAIVLLILAMAYPVYARWSIGGVGGVIPVVAGGPCQGSDPSDCTRRETFEGTVACYGAIGNYCDAAWDFFASSWSPHNATSPLQGTYDAVSTNTDQVTMLDSFTAADEMYATMMVSIPDNTAVGGFALNFYDASDNILASVESYQNWIIGANAGGTDAAFVLSGMANDTKYYVKVRAKKGTGANAECEIWASTTTTWGSSTLSNDGTWTAQIAKIGAWKAQSGVKVDDIRVYTGNISY